MDPTHYGEERRKYFSISNQLLVYLQKFGKCPGCHNNLHIYAAPHTPSLNVRCHDCDCNVVLTVSSQYNTVQSLVRSLYCDLNVQYQEKLVARLRE